MNEGEVWNGETWLLFSLAVGELGNQLHLSLGAAERTLRELCASGDVRAIRCPVDSQGVATYEEEPTWIAPSEWFASSVDHQDWVEVSEHDLWYWVNNHQQPTKDRASKKRDLAQLAVNELWPGGVEKFIRTSRS
jgi:hypothetical protein